MGRTEEGFRLFSTSGSFFYVKKYLPRYCYDIDLEISLVTAIHSYILPLKEQSRREVILSLTRMPYYYITSA